MCVYRSLPIAVFVSLIVTHSLLLCRLFKFEWVIVGCLINIACVKPKLLYLNVIYIAKIW